MIEKLQKYVGIKGWRALKVIKEIIVKCKEDAKFDAGERVSMKRRRKRKMKQEDVDLAGKMLRR